MAVADIQAERTQHFAALYGAKGYADYNELLEKADLDIVSVCTSDELHLKPVLAAAAAGKHILVEKPLAVNVPDCDTMIQAAENAGVKLMVGQILRFDPRYYAARQAISDGQIGAPVHFFARRNNLLKSAKRLGKHTSVLFFLGIHDIDFINWCAESKVERVYAESVSRVLRDMDTADSYLALIKFQDGTIASLEVSWILPESQPYLVDHCVKLIGSKGSTYVDLRNRGLEKYCEKAEYTSGGDTINGYGRGFSYDSMYHFLDCIIKDKEPISNETDGLMNTAILCAMLDSAEKGEQVKVEI